MAKLSVTVHANKRAPPAWEKCPKPLQSREKVFLRLDTHRLVLWGSESQNERRPARMYYAAAIIRLELSSSKYINNLQSEHEGHSLAVNLLQSFEGDVPRRKHFWFIHLHLGVSKDTPSISGKIGCEQAVASRICVIASLECTHNTVSKYTFIYLFIFFFKKKDS